tara:strand:- start:5462 stop:5641 length:180 start_codon:yes stop_codon:yes gene_type:complete
MIYATDTLERILEKPKTLYGSARGAIALAQAIAKPLEREILLAELRETNHVANSDPEAN